MNRFKALCFADGVTISRMPLVRDYKRLLENDIGPNTGGKDCYLYK